MHLHNQGQSFDWVMYRMVHTLQGVKPGMGGFCSLLPQKTKSNVCSFCQWHCKFSSMCIFNVIEQSGKELLKCSMSWAVIVSIGLCTVISYMYFWPSRVKMFVNFMHASVAGVISVGHLVVATSMMEVHKRLMFAG